MATKSETAEVTALRRANAQLKIENTALRKTVSRLHKDSRIDPLTGLGNLRQLKESLMMHVKELSRVSSSLSLVVIDMDGLKKINDTFGHSVGNEALKVFARQLKEIVRLSDIACRFGGDEFGVILPYTDERAASYFIERLSTLLSGKSMRVSVGHEKTKMEIPIRMSAGSGTIKGILKWKNLRDVETTVNAMLHAADKNMYFNKRANKMARKEANEQNTKAAIDKET